MRVQFLLGTPKECRRLHSFYVKSMMIEKEGI